MKKLSTVIKTSLSRVQSQQSQPIYNRIFLVIFEYFWLVLWININ